MATAIHTTPIFPWLEAYSVGIPKIDLEHKGLIRLINDLHASMAAGTTKEALGKILDELVHYTEKHFAQEEGIMRLRGYSRLAAHQTVHVKLTRQVIELRDKHRAGQITLSIEVMRFLKDWLADHIMVHDQEYARELKTLR